MASTTSPTLTLPFSLLLLAYFLTFIAKSNIKAFPQELSGEEHARDLNDLYFNPNIISNLQRQHLLAKYRTQSSFPHSFLLWSFAVARYTREGGLINSELQNPLSRPGIIENDKASLNGSKERLRNGA